LLVVSGLDVDRSEEAMIVNMCVNIKKVTREGKMVVAIIDSTDQLLYIYDAYMI